MKINRQSIAKTATGAVVGAVTLMTSLPALAHSEHASTMSGIVHFMTEPDHLVISGIVAVAVVLVVRRVGRKRV